MQPVSNVPVLVTGGTGFLAGHLIQQLLAKGYRVRATVRDIQRTDYFAYLSRFPESAEKLEIVEANLLSAESKGDWDRALRGGVEYVFHTVRSFPPHYDIRYNYLYSILC